ncbi:MAG TPA: hypothetical protein DDW50_09420 [Firmicutes bacterium]|jgi:hypothetical protein|nr:hypothetical protein [Bacillota bacterium]
MLMKRARNCFYLCCIGLLLLLSGVVWAADLTLGEIEAGNYPMISINNHMPSLYKNTDQYWKSLQRVQLELGHVDQFKDVPKLGLKNPYTGKIKFGDKPDESFGVIVDIVGEEKRLYIDTDGDGSFAGEKWVPLLNEWYGNQNYWIIAPEPIRLMVSYRSKPGQKVPIDISVSGALIDAGFNQKVKPFLLIEDRTWFLAKVMEDGYEKMVAVIDYNHNGCFNDPVDLVAVDYNDDSFFTMDEAQSRKKGIVLKSKNKKWKVDWDAYPDVLRIGREGN